MHVEQFSSVNNLAVKYVHLTVVQVLYVYLTIVYGKNDGAHVRSMPKRSLFWQLGRHDHLGRWLCITTTLPKSYDSIFISHFSLTVFWRFHEKWRETTLKNSKIFWHRVKSHLSSFVCILPKECCRPLSRCQKISLFLIMFSRHFSWKRQKTVRRTLIKKSVSLVFC